MLPGAVDKERRENLMYSEEDLIGPLTKPGKGKQSKGSQ